MTKEPVLRTKELAVSYGALQALQPLNLSLGQGDLIGVIGPNGAGKTSFIKALCGNVPYEGEIMIAGQIIKAGASRKQYIGLVPQNIALYSHLTARENLSVFAKLLGVKRSQIKARAEKALKIVGMSANGDKRVSELSGGMQRRINVAIAILNDPPVIIFDEPTAGIDIPARDSIHELAKRLAEEGKTVLLITHELAHIDSLCDKILFLNKGIKEFFDAPSKILSSVYGNHKQVSLGFSRPPTANDIAAMAPFDFKPKNLPTLWEGFTDASEVSFVSAFMTAMAGRQDIIQEISVRKPGFATLIYDYQNQNENTQ